ncbi:MAG: TRAM domain-containing protein, partial [Candidatus Neomarinimicrobiota bacterium]
MLLLSYDDIKVLATKYCINSHAQQTFPVVNSAPMEIESPPQETAAPLPKKGEEIELTVESLAYGGQGVARLDGFVVLLEKGALPGSKV